MQSTRTGSGRSFSLVVLGSVFVVFAATAALLGGFVFWSSAEVDETGVSRQATRVVSALRQQLEQMSHDQESVAVWDDTLSAVSRRDITWLNRNVGRQMASYFRHTASYILDGDGTPIYAATAGRRAQTESYRELAPMVDPLVAELREKTRLGYVDIPPSIADYVVLGGEPAIVGVFPIVSPNGEGERPPGEEPVLVSVIRLDLDYELGMIDRYMLEAGRFTTQPSGRDLSVFPVANRSGRIVAFYEWQPYLPGSELMRQTGPALATAFAVLGLVVALLLHRLWRSSRALESKHIDAERQATEDPLTHLPNRLSFERQFDQIIREPGPSRPLPRLLMLDLDRFKQVNDTLGHHAGDDLIRAVGERLRHVVGPEAVLARLGGDEFAILSLDSLTEPEVMELCRRIIETIARPFRIGGNEAFVGVSIGVVMARPQDRNRHELTRKADIALYEAKSSGRNRAAIYEESMNELVQTRHSIEAELREALKLGDQLWVAFQPLFGREGNVVGAEALVRWTHPRRGPVSPAHFVPIAESSGLIEALGEVVLRRACQMGARWPGHTIAVNISPAQMRNPTFADRIFAILDETGMRPEDLEIEITESILLDDELAIADAIRSFRRAGIKIALDDFGTGYSSLNYLKRYPVDRIKIDRSFISQLSSGGASTAIVQALVTLAHALGIEVTAEGVETDEQYHVLASMGCNTFQGYRFSTPLAPEALEMLLAPARPALPVARVA